MTDSLDRLFLMRAKGRIRSRSLRNPLIGCIVLIELGHLSVTLLGAHRDLWSNVFQLLMSSFTLVLCMRERQATTFPATKRGWLYVAVAFSLWSLAQIVYLHDMCYPALYVRGRNIDDALWLLVGLPLLVAVYPTIHDSDVVRWLDRLQILIIFLVLYLLVFQTPRTLSVESAYTLQNVLLVLCCFVRLSAETADRERPFFIRLAIFLSLYAILGISGDFLFARGWSLGTPLDVVWTLPFATFCFLLLRGSEDPGEPQRTFFRRVSSIGLLHTLSIGILPVLSIGASVHLSQLHRRLGLCFLGVSVTAFLFRVAKRESNWERVHRTLEQAVLRDPLTGLGNRVLLRKRLQEEASSGKADEKLVFIFADLDKFKSVNDSLGHEHGDKLLVQVGQRLSTASPPGSTVCRLGGDEFIVLTKAEDVASAEIIGQLLLNVIREPFELGRHTVRCTASLGIVVAEDGEMVDDLLRTADDAMYQAKQSGRNRVTSFGESWRRSISARWNMQADLRETIQNVGIQVAFQPIVDLRSAAICGFEALARWSHPIHGPVPPSQFVEMAEELGLIGDLGRQVLLNACTQTVRWNKALGEEFSISVNLSPRQIADPDLVDDVSRVLEKTRLEARLLKLEITESALLVGMTDVKRVLHDLRRLGVSISLDDFGTGYSSLSFLLNLPVDEIKVDRSFVSNMESASERKTIVQKVIQLGHGLDKMIVAEGAETAEDLQNLISMNCQQVQGWFLCRPQDARWIDINLEALRVQVQVTLEEIRSRQFCGALELELATAALV